MYSFFKVISLRHSHQLIYKKQESKTVSGVFLNTLGTPNKRKFYGCGGFTSKLSLRCFSSNSNITGNSSDCLKELMKINKSNNNHVNHKLIHMVSDLNVLILSYEQIKSKPGNNTTGSDLQTFDKINLNWFKKISTLLLAGKFKFKPARWININKKTNKKNNNKNTTKKIKKWTLTINSFWDKIVQQAIYCILQIIFEPVFLKCSHGSRSNKGIHTVLKNVKYQFGGVKWCIKGDIKNNFPSVSHKILLNLLKRRITCSKFLALIKNALKSGFYENGKFKESNIGLFQGSIISPILNNIYLHEFDKYMAELCKSFKKGKSRWANPNYQKISYWIKKQSDPKIIKKLRRELWKIQSKDPMDPNFKRLYYVRFVDDFVAGVIGSRKNAVTIKKKIYIFLLNTLKLTLSNDKTTIKQFSKRYIKFLGTLIKSTWKKQKRIILIKKNGVTKKVRMTSWLVLQAPIKAIFERAADYGFFFKRSGKFIPTKVGWLINLDHADIIKQYNKLIHGNLKYYSFANNHKSLGSFVHGLKLSCAWTLAIKFKLRYASKAFKKFGGKLKCKKTQIELYIPKSFKATKVFFVTNQYLTKHYIKNGTTNLQKVIYIKTV